MGYIYTDEEREKIRRIFSEARHQELPISTCCEMAGISVSTVMKWNSGSGWSKTKKSLWDKGDGWSK
ncbi:MAG: hypothetical protein U1A72_12540 [Sulfuritalea sp.]|nr:hypothetical protein [Sulfuritalea sp.]